MPADKYLDSNDVFWPQVPQVLGVVEGWMGWGGGRGRNRAGYSGALLYGAAQLLRIQLHSPLSLPPSPFVLPGSARVLLASPYHHH